MSKISPKENSSGGRRPLMLNHLKNPGALPSSTSDTFPSLYIFFFTNFYNNKMLNMILL
jgi:hypothetical protein